MVSTTVGKPTNYCSACLRIMLPNFLQRFSIYALCPDCREEYHGGGLSPFVLFRVMETLWLEIWRASEFITGNSFDDVLRPLSVLIHFGTWQDTSELRDAIARLSREESMPILERLFEHSPNSYSHVQRIVSIAQYASRVLDKIDHDAIAARPIHIAPSSFDSILKEYAKLGGNPWLPATETNRSVTLPSDHVLSVESEEIYSAVGHYALEDERRASFPPYFTCHVCFERKNVCGTILVSGYQLCSYCAAEYAAMCVQDTPHTLEELMVTVFAKKHERLIRDDFTRARDTAELAIAADISQAADHAVTHVEPYEGWTDPEASWRTDEFHGIIAKLKAARQVYSNALSLRENNYTSKKEGEPNITSSKESGIQFALPEAVREAARTIEIPAPPPSLELKKGSIVNPVYIPNGESGYWAFPFPALAKHVGRSMSQLKFIVERFEGIQAKKLGQDWWGNLESLQEHLATHPRGRRTGAKDKTPRTRRRKSEVTLRPGEPVAVAKQAPGVQRP